METLAKQQQQLKIELKKKKDICLNEIQAFRIDINKTIDQLEQTTIKDLDDQFSALDQSFENEMQAVQKTLDDLRKQKLSAEASDVNTSQQFVSLKLCQTEITEAENLISGGSLSIDKNSLCFERNSEMLAFLQSLYSLDKPQYQMTEQRVLPRRTKESLYQVKAKYSFNVKLPKDQKTCSISSMCLLDSGYLLVTDNRNKVLKLVDGVKKKIRNSVEMPDASNSVDTINAEEAIVCLKNNSLQFVSTRDKLMLTRRLKTDHCCLGVCVIASYIFVTDGRDRNIFKYDIKGTLLKKNSGNEIFFWNRYILGTKDENAIYVTDDNNGLIKMDLEGNIIWNLSGEGLKNAFGLCSDGLGNVFVADSASHTVVQVTSDGKCLGDVVAEPSRVYKPYGVCFNSKASKLFVSGNCCNDIYVYSLE
ncbi:E3 ubiquitin-protein ligase TRIM56-like [Mercenaria mercenaria]|uniref:E3 ubiquitin-protein ligase TRIM56-like n=1 Tax=Mercenaria mercenaria TaxID=6596 RepID=UPI00234EF418|nr:E3 ubiquitin-protein ligase TRIM56-like [Mercenaria mercenaria]